MASENGVPPLFVTVTRDLRAWVEAASEPLARLQGNPQKLSLQATVRYLLAEGLKACGIEKPEQPEEDTPDAANG